MYWRLRDIPELQVVPAARQRRLWSEAVTRSLTVRDLLVTLMGYMLGALLFAAVGYLVWPQADHGLLLGLIGIPVAGFINEFAWAQPRARRWLRAHASELDRYLP